MTTYIDIDADLETLEDEERPVILIDCKEHRIVRQALSFLSTEKDDIYQHRGRLVRIYDEYDPEPYVRRLTVFNLIELLSRAICWEEKVDEETCRDIYVPLRIAKMIRDCGEYPSEICRLEKIVFDHTHKPGFDEGSECFFVYNRSQTEEWR